MFNIELSLMIWVHFLIVSLETNPCILLYMIQMKDLAILLSQKMYQWYRQISWYHHEEGDFSFTMNYF